MQSLLSGCSKENKSTCTSARGWRYLLQFAGIGFALLFGLNHSVQAASFNTIGSMSTVRQSHTATLLDSSGVLIAGGLNAVTGATLNGAELYDTEAGTFSLTGSMADARRSHTATKLSNGKVLIAGGNSGGSSPLSSAELYDPGTKTFSATGSLTATGRQLHTATLLKSGKVLLIGGRGSYSSSSSSFNTAEIYDPATGLFTAANGTMKQSRAYHTATLLEDGRVLVTGGIIPGGASTATAEIFDPATGLFADTDDMTAARNFHAAVLLNDGTVLITGGANGSTGASLNTAEIFNPATGLFAEVGSTMSAAHSKHSATLLANGYVLIAGSSDSFFPETYISTVAELYIPGSDFPFVYDMNTARASHSATLLGNGMVLLAGGSSDVTAGTASAELFNVASIVVVPGDYTFPTTLVNHTAPARTFTLSNDSDTEINVSAVSISGQDSAMFVKTGNCGTLQPQGSCTVNVTFTPASTGLKSAALDINSDDELMPHFSVHLRGTGLTSIPGDCDTNGIVTITEVQNAIKMFLGQIAVTGCVDTNGSNGVSAAEVQKVINGFLGP